MSRIGNAPIKLPNGVEFKFQDGAAIVKGAKGELVQQILSDHITVKQEDSNLVLERTSEDKDTKSKHGLYRALIQNMVIGVSEGYKKNLELVGVGYRANVTGQQLELTLGYSHNIIFLIPDEIKVSTTAERGKNPTVLLESHDKQLLGQVAAKIRSLRKPEPYKGKGVKFVGEQIRRKAGKSAAKK